MSLRRSPPSIPPADPDEGPRRFGSPWITLHLGRLELRLHFCLALVAAALALVAGGLGGRYLLLVATLLLHELAHALAALAVGGGRAVVRLWPYFGRADVPRSRGWRGALVALAAPGANLTLALGLILLHGAQVTLALGRCPLPDLVASANLLMGIGNLLPLPPVDGGRALAALRRGSAPSSPPAPPPPPQA